jgi:heavy metal translocating P-type ATPase
LKSLKPGDQVHVRPGERIPCDGVIMRGAAMVDEQIVTGESAAAVREPGDSVFGGSHDLDGDLFIEATAAGGAGALERLINLVRDARSSKGRFERLADRVSQWFIPIVMCIALATFVTHANRFGPDRGILAALAVILIACPCALGLATPLAVWTAMGQAARGQVVFLGGAALEQLSGVRSLLVDKTGTLTTGTPFVQRFIADDVAVESDSLLLARSLAAASSHDYAHAVRRFADARLDAHPHHDLGRVNGARTVAGRGVRSNDSFLGSARWMEELGLHMPEQLNQAIAAAYAAGRSLTCVARDGTVTGIFVLCEELRPEAAEAITRLRNLGLAVTGLTGDHRARASALERELGITFLADLRPEDKVASVERSQSTVGPTAMVGDGLNDAPALAQSDVGIAMGCGADVTRESASVCLLGNDLLRLPWAIKLSRRTVRVIRQNLFWAFFYNILGIGLACAGLLNPIIAALAMSLSSFIVVTNSLRLRREETGSTAADSVARLHESKLISVASGMAVISEGHGLQ